MEIASYITGFVDGEGCFHVSFSFRKERHDKLEIRPSFSISQNQRSTEVLNVIQRYFQCGYIRRSVRDSTLKYEVRSLTDLERIIIPHFEKYQLQTSKQADFVHFAEIVKILRANRSIDRTKESLIIEKAYLMNKSGTRRYDKAHFLRQLTR